VIERALIDYFRCPNEFVKMTLAGELSPDTGYFRFGPSICYGQTVFGTRATSATDDLDDLAPRIRPEAGLLTVPFDPSQIVDNLRFERYVTAISNRDALRRSWWNRTYYALRGFIPASLRRALQRSYFRNWHSLPFPQWPVDTTVDDILKQLFFLTIRGGDAERVPFVWFWPNGAASCAIVTHDVETARGRDRCSWLMDINDSHGIKASFQLIPEGRYELTPAMLDTIRTRGFELNLHDLNHDGLLFSDRAEFERRASRINEHARALGARGFRSGQLYRRADWYGALDIAYDMSVPNAAHLEVQRGGCCTVMPYFIGDIVELPLTTTQDYSLFHIVRDYSTSVWQKQIDRIVAAHGLVSFIAHPDYLIGDQAVKAYRTLLDRLDRLRDERRCWIPLPGAVERWWRQRSRMRLVRDGSRWRIEGDGAERARIAWAEIHDGQLSYRIGSGPSE
jgi:hypothetical protein